MSFQSALVVVGVQGEFGRMEMNQTSKSEVFASVTKKCFIIYELVGI